MAKIQIVRRSKEKQVHYIYVTYFNIPTQSWFKSKVDAWTPKRNGILFFLKIS